MEKNQIHFGKKFYLDSRPAAGYWISTTCPKIYAHRWVWMNNFGDIPKGYHIHHRDGNKSNNDISNLLLVSPSTHANLHMTKDRKEKAIERCDNILHLTKAWHASPEGLAWHKYHAIKCKFGKNDPVDYVCIQCDSEFKSSKLSMTKFCANKCKSAYRRASKIDDEKRTCLKCEKDFVVNKYSKSKCCSRSCGKKRSL